MSPFDIASILIAIVCIPATLWYFWKCTGYVGELCTACLEAIRQEHVIPPPIIIEAHNGMTAEELDALVDRMEALRDQRASVLAS